MDPIKQAIEALERICDLTDTSRESFENVDEWTREYARGIRGLAQPALAALRKLDAEIEQGFEEYRKSRPWLSDVGVPVAQDAYRAGQFARIPAKIREVLIEACDLAEDALTGRDSTQRFTDAAEFLKTR